MKDIKVISFDMDGTLVDLKFVDLVWQEGIPLLYAKKEGIVFEEARERVRSEYKKFGEYAIEWYDITFWFDYFSFEESWEEMVDRYRHEIEVFAEVPKVLDALKDDYQLIVGSNATREFIDRELHGYESYFKHTFSSTSDFDQVKKTSDFYANICNVMGVSPEEIVHVGDHWEFDYLAPRELGITSFFLDRDGKKTGDVGDLTVSDLEEMCRYITDGMGDL
ncbi:MAG: HAD family hydrolase [Halobacteriota archaeon]|nr:HAD family hydrolase [Halobacteriota archaeon]